MQSASYEAPLKQTVAIFTASRAEYGLLYPLIDALRADPRTEAMVFAGGSHLTTESGRTIREIQTDGIPVMDHFDYLLNEADSAGLSRSLGIATMELARLFDRYDFDYVCVLGDRYELLAIVSCAILFRKPIIHIHGGESTHGLLDEQIRHMVTKSAHLHFVTCALHADRIRKMGESDWRIHTTGALAIDRITRMKFRSKYDLCDELKLDPHRPISLVTYHPVTLEMNIEIAEQVDNLFHAMQRFPMQWIVTAPNIEIGREEIVSQIQQQVVRNSDIHYIESLGADRYFSLIPHCQIVIGNSSSGILEVPYFRIPSVNVGDRQAGRTRHRSVIDTGYSEDEVAEGIHTALTPGFRAGLRTMEFQFGDGHAASRMVDIIAQTTIDQNLLRKRLEFPAR
jgi:UDP-hydrolysing UDP-N-acetyl-D-glucosamine 2-epimerase